MRRRAVITGLGLVTPIGAGVAEFWSRALAGSAACSSIPEAWRRHFEPLSTVWAPLPSRDFSSFDIGRIEASQLDRVEQIALACARQALDGAGISYVQRDAKKNTYALCDVDPLGFGVFVGAGVGGATTLVSTMVAHVCAPAVASLRKLAGRLDDEGAAPAAADVRELSAALQTGWRYDPFGVAKAMPNGSAALIGIKYGLLGRNSTCCAACASGTVAIGQALRAVQSGELALALAGGVEYLGDDWGGLFRGFDTARTLARVAPGDDPARANRPFDARRSGFLFSEGGGALLLVEELEHARRRGATPLAEVVGYGETFDAHSVMMMDPSAAQIERMVRQALDDARVAPGEIDYVNTHGTSTLLNDETESAMLCRVFGQGPLVNSTKGLIGHTLGASGAIEAAVTALSIRDRTTHPCLNLEQPIGSLRYVREPGRFPIACALSESFAFGGHNAALVLREIRD